MATSWKSQQGDGMYSLQFETDDIDKYKLVEKASQMAIDGITDIAEVKHGEWIEDKTHISKRRKKYVCSNCLHYITIKTTTDINSRRYCYECGAKMKIKEN